MKTIYKVILVLFVIVLGINLYAFDWQLGFLHDGNTLFLLSASASLLGIIATLILGTWNQLAQKNNTSN